MNEQKEIYFRTVKRAIVQDKDTWVWFINALSQESLYSELTESSSLSLTGLRLKRFSSLAIESSTYIALALYYFYKDPIYIVIAAVTFVAAMLYTRYLKKICSSLGESLLRKFYPELDLKEQTLYQISEEISQKKKILSLVDIINIRENILISSWLIASVIAFSLRVPEMSLLQRSVLILIFFGSLALLQRIIRINLVFKRKK